MATDLSGKRVALLKEIVPGLSRLALIIDPKDISSKRSVLATTAAAKSLGIELLPIETETLDALGSALASLEVADGHALLV
ncbi:hypothetical protein, partial [Staphylococcus aureus]